MHFLSDSFAVRREARQRSTESMSKPFAVNETEN